MGIGCAVLVSCWEFRVLVIWVGEPVDRRWKGVSREHYRLGCVCPAYTYSTELK